MRTCYAVIIAFVIALLLMGCDHPVETCSLSEARRGFKTKLTRQVRDGEAVPQPPPNLFRLIHYPSPAGSLAAYVSRAPADGRRRPAIIWITGGDCNTIGDVWHAMPADNDQTAHAFHDAGIVTMFPSLRGGNNNPGVEEGFLGEVDDVLAAADYLAKDPSVDPGRIYLGGHSIGGTMALLVAESSPRFRDVFAFGPVSDIGAYGGQFAPIDLNDRTERILRSPGYWLPSIHSPVFIFEGTEQPSNLTSLRKLTRIAASNRFVQCYPVSGETHFSILAPITRLIAQRILADSGPKTQIAFKDEELNAAAASQK